jgi:hypothetical protein
MNLTVYFEEFRLPSTPESIELYKSVQKYKLIFIQLTSSCGKSLNISNLLEKYYTDENTLLICNDKNLYQPNEEKHILCAPFLRNKLVHYVDTIKNSSEIYLIDSCFSCIIIPYQKTNQLKASVVRIINRKDDVVI